MPINKGVLSDLLQCDMLLHAKSVSIREKTFFASKHHFFAKKLAGFGIFAYLCPRETIETSSEDLNLLGGHRYWCSETSGRSRK